ncbi:hypothetical protein JHK87_027268 [Glycine soja]|nr:hypothetical protein JHK87_027268 [Glycine soja]
MTIFVKIRDLDLGVTLHSMITTLKLGMFIDNLCRKQPKDLDELRAKVTRSSRWRNYLLSTTKYVLESRKRGTHQRQKVGSEPQLFQALLKRSDPNLNF